ncbi:cation-dependent mannose-6-phosphate receptor-like isoform X3 [Dendronephthya gigantea]|uniref:cation-dependent mannose-6-phosphate receptor-like isoform X3 n=1 Tax=Dendronephthya gigantea TaxID=151771 RepID=UPI00106BF9A6|nr:cation-dependent mannose-6-phosphate receptor-like isoform X3 [Dendronephthya gigantea]
MTVKHGRTIRTVLTLNRSSSLILEHHCIQHENLNYSLFRTFHVEDDVKRYRYTINLCQQSVSSNVAVLQNDLSTGGEISKIGIFDQYTHAFGGDDWLILTFFGANYITHCGKARRKVIIMIQCDRSADTSTKRQPRILEEYRPKDPKAPFCYYLFEMKHDAACTTSTGTKISPGSVFIIILVVVGVLYLVLGSLYQRFIVGAKGMEQIPNYLMWREFGSLQADGCNYMCRCKGTREPTRYKPMDDAIADDEDFRVEDDDNDDTMLPM